MVLGFQQIFVTKIVLVNLPYRRIYLSPVQEGFNIGILIVDTIVASKKLSLWQL